MTILLIICGISLLGIIFMIRGGLRHVRYSEGNQEGLEMHPVEKHLHDVFRKMNVIFTYLLHSCAAIASRGWARISHFVSQQYKSIVRRIEDYFRHKHEHNLNKNPDSPSLLLTTIKAYKKEIRKLNQKIEPDPIDGEMKKEEPEVKK